MAKYPALAALMERAIDDSGLSQRELASRLVISETTVSNWKRGVRPPTIEMVNAVCALLALSPDTLLRAIGIELHPPAFAKLPRDLQDDLLFLWERDRASLAVVAQVARGQREYVVHREGLAQ